MTSTHTDPDTRTQPPSDTRPRPRLQLSATQLIASALAAVTATIAASYLGVSGTVIGAALASVLTVSGNAVYGNSLHRTADRVRTVVPAAPRWLSPAGREAPPSPPPRPPLPRRRLVLATVAVFTAMLVMVTSVELVAGRPLSDLLRGRSGNGTTVFGPPEHQTRHPQPGPATVTRIVTPSVVETTPTVTQTAPTVTATKTPTVTSLPSSPTPTPSTPAAIGTPTP